ncbi:PadR family transcriptional regulator [Clostridiales bacterium COT073_COT-073]|nr:PadR family transcriptional regulator [Clostridiales bacterium COT073_COT-073]
MISSDIMRGYHDIIICLLLAEGDNYGYMLSAQIEARSRGKYQIKEATLYSALNRLEKNGCIISYEGNETFGRSRTYYRLSSIGKQFLREKAMEWQDTQEVINEFFKETNYE